MDIDGILAELKAERDRIERAITAIEGLNSTGRQRAGRPPQPTRKRRTPQLRGQEWLPPSVQGGRKQGRPLTNRRGG